MYRTTLTLAVVMAILISLMIGFSGCASVKIPEFKAHITLPASEDGYWVKTVGTEEGRIPKEDWDILKKRGIILLSDDWAILRNTILENCLALSCKNAVGTFDGLFYSIDKALKKIPVTP